MGMDLTYAYPDKPVRVLAKELRKSGLPNVNVVSTKRGSGSMFYRTLNGWTDDRSIQVEVKENPADEEDAPELAATLTVTRGAEGVSVYVVAAHGQWRYLRTAIRSVVAQAVREEESLELKHATR